jgi:hypothetical protein
MARAHRSSGRWLFLAGWIAGAALTGWPAGIHLYLWYSGYGDIETIGVLFLLNAIGGFALACPLCHPARAASVRHTLRKSFARHDRAPEDRVDDFLRTMRLPRNRRGPAQDMLRVERSVRWMDTERDLHLDVPVQVLWAAKTATSRSTSSNDSPRDCRAWTRMFCQAVGTHCTMIFQNRPMRWWRPS